MGMTLVTLASIIAGVLLFWFLSLIGCPLWGCLLGGGLLVILVSSINWDSSSKDKEGE